MRVSLTPFDTHLPLIQSLKINSGLEITRGIEASVKRLSGLKCFDFKTQIPEDSEYYSYYDFIHSIPNHMNIIL